jgi:magnesium transporter
LLDRHLLEGELRAHFAQSVADEEELRLLLEHSRPTDLAEILPRLEVDERVRIIRLLAGETAGTVLDETDEDVEIEILEGLERSEIADIVDETSPDEAADILGLLPEGEEHQVLAEVEDREHAEEIRQLLTYEDDSAGGVMTTEFVTVPPEATVQTALAEVRDATDVESVPYVYVVEPRTERLTGVSSLRDLIEVEPQTPIREVMESDLVTIAPEEDQEKASKLVDRYDLAALPVVDAQRRLLGVVTFDDAMDVMDEEAEEDILRLAGAGPIERPMSAPVARRIRVRLPWLVVTLLGATAAVVVLSAFEATFEQKLALAMFTPVLAAMCGNIAMQSTAMLVRAFATGEVELRQTARIVGGELLVGTGLGALCGILGGILAAVLFGDVLLGAIVTISMALGMVVAILVGTLTPIVLIRLDIDPAVASGPFVTTLNDVTGLATYAATATFLIRAFPG